MRSRTRRPNLAKQSIITPAARLPDSTAIIAESGNALPYAINPPSYLRRAWVAESASVFQSTNSRSAIPRGRSHLKMGPRTLRTNQPIVPGSPATPLLRDYAAFIGFPVLPGNSPRGDARMGEAIAPAQG